MEYYKTYCSTHPYESVTNFCADPQCLIGLCATCICEHTQQHLKRGTPPAYENIKNTFTKYNDKIREQVGKIEQDKEWLGVVCQKIEEKRKNVKVILSKARDDCVALVHKHFDELEFNVDSEISNESKKNSLHSAYRLQTLNTLLLKEINSLLLYSKDLNSGKFLETIPQVDHEVFPNSNEFHQRVSKQLKQNEVYTANVVYREELLADVLFGLKRLVNLQFLLPRVQCYEQVRRQDFRRPNSMKKTGNTSVIISPSSKQYTDFSKLRNVSAILSPGKQSISVMMPTPPIQQILNPSNYKNQNQSSTLSKGNRLSSCLKVIRESRRQNTVNEQSRSMTNSSVSYDKQNELAHSTYCDSASNFFK